MERSNRLHTQVCGLIEEFAQVGEAPTSAAFERLAMELFAWQVDSIPAYRHYCEDLGRVPGRVQHSTEIPAVPTEVWRHVDLFAFPSTEATWTFLTSGTTAGRRGRHLLRRPDTYDRSARAWLRPFLLPKGDRPLILALIASPQDTPDSSLSFMVGRTIDVFGTIGSGCLWDEQGPRLDACATALRAAQAAGRPVLLLSTARALLALLDGPLAAGALVLPRGSRVMETGGWKGASVDLGRDPFYSRIEDGLGLPAHAIVSEYGMTELGSQGYHPGLRLAEDPAFRESFGDLRNANPDPQGVPRTLLFPPWCQVSAVDPDSLNPLPEGQIGLLRFVDLSNVDSIIAVQTADIGSVTDQGVCLLGRAPGATPRGCSLAVEEILGDSYRG